MWWQPKARVVAFWCLQLAPLLSVAGTYRLLARMMMASLCFKPPGLGISSHPAQAGACKRPLLLEQTGAASGLIYARIAQGLALTVKQCHMLLSHLEVPFKKLGSHKRWFPVFMFKSRADRCMLFSCQTRAQEEHAKGCAVEFDCRLLCGKRCREAACQSYDGQTQETI